MRLRLCCVEPLQNLDLVLYCTGLRTPVRTTSHPARGTGRDQHKPNFISAVLYRGPKGLEMTRTISLGDDKGNNKRRGAGQQASAIAYFDNVRHVCAARVHTSTACFVEDFICRRIQIVSKVELNSHLFTPRINAIASCVRSRYCTKVSLLRRSIVYSHSLSSSSS